VQHTTFDDRDLHTHTHTTAHSSAISQKTAAPRPAATPQRPATAAPAAQESYVVLTHAPTTDDCLLASHSGTLRYCTGQWLKSITVDWCLPSSSNSAFSRFLWDLTAVCTFSPIQDPVQTFDFNQPLLHPLPHSQQH
jgi:hypothetical protein